MYEHKSNKSIQYSLFKIRIFRVIKAIRCLFMINVKKYLLIIKLFKIAGLLRTARAASRGVDAKDSQVRGCSMESICVASR